MTPQELKNSILQLAIQGKIVPQDPSEGTGEELYRQIQVEKAKLIKAKLIKEDKELPEPDDYPFDIPESWKWARITDCGAFISGYTPKPNQLADKGTIPYFKVADMNTVGNEIFMSITNSYLSDDAPQKYYLKNTIVYPKNGGAVFTNKKRILSRHSVVDLNTGGYSVIGPVDLMYFYYYFTQIDFKQCYKGTALPTIDMDRLKRRWVPLPPLAEQRRIVAKIEELLPLIDRYEEAWTKLEAFNKRFPEDMQKSILQMAIQGKLVPQDPSEGTGEELYKQIQAEKAKLIKEGKIKKEKPLPEISEDEVPFEIPNSWKWVRLIDVIRERPTNGFSPKGVDYKTEVRNLTLTATTSGFFRADAYKYVDVQLTSDSKYWLKNGDILIQRSNSRELVGTSCIYNGDDNDFIYPDLMMRIHCLESVDTKFIDYTLKAPMTRNYYSKKASGTSESMPKINQSVVSETVIPLPSLAEQRRIVAKLEELLPLCEKLKKAKL